MAPIVLSFMAMPRNPWILILALPALWMGRAQEAQFQQARQVGSLAVIPTVEQAPAASQTLETTAGADTDSFGVQQFLSEKQRARYFHTFAQITALVTNNAALTRVDRRSDSFLVASLGLEYRRPLSRGWQVDSGFQLSMFRYNEYRVLDFNSLDVGVGLSYHLEKLGGVDFFARYNFTALTDTYSADAILQSHTVVAGVQKAVAFNPAHGIYAGLAAQTSLTDPKPQERSEFAAFAGYRVQATRHLEADLLYRYAYIPYTDSDRRDHNQTVSLGVRYRFTEWFSAYAAGFAGWNASNVEAFRYEDVKGGGGLTLDLRF